MILERPYSKDTFAEFLKDFLPDFTKDERSVRTPDKSILTEVTQLGISKEINLTILEAVCEETDSKKRIAITQAAFKVLRDHGIRNALIAFHDGADQWRLSLLTSTLELQDGKVIKKDSNPRRYSYLLGIGAKTRTPHKYLIEKGKVADINSLQGRFSVEVVNKQFYESIADLFTKLVGGERGRTRYPGLLKISGQTNQNNEHQEFAVRLIGRIIFSWFLKEKKSAAGVPIVPDELLSLDAVASHNDYYHSILEPLFFELLNKRINNRHEALRQGPFATVPYLNGGLFSPQYDDYYQQNSFTGGGNPGIVSIPDSWFNELFTVLEQYNFTVDENTSYDVDLSIDPEMLGRIFENLLAEINPETGESARKSTGSFYTPREIVDYMVDSSLREYLKTKTGIDDKKLHAIISWGQEDDVEHPLSSGEKKRIVDALATLTILDPACGSGAFPIGILQKVVYILQQVDERAEIWLENQLKYVTSPELRRDIEEKYRSENYDWLRKLGVIRESIFGVDIQTIATEIAKLRCFLTLVIEEEVDDEKENRGIRPLPNLDFKFVTANSLISLPESSSKKSPPAGSLNMFEDLSHISRLKEIRNKYFGADADERARLQVEFKDLQLSMFKSRIASSGATSDLYNVLSDWNPFTHDRTDWFDSEWMFGVDGFDIVIANPPYVGEKGHKTLFDQLKTSPFGKKYYNRKMDLFYFFFHLGLDNLNDSGILTFISTNYYPTADGAIKLRKDFYERTNVLELINFNEYKVFESALGQHNLITILQKVELPQSDFRTKQTLVKIKGGPNANELNGFLTHSSKDAAFTVTERNNLFDGDDYSMRISSSGVGADAVLDKIALAGKPLGELCDINMGVQTGADTIGKALLKRYIAKNNSDGGYSIGDRIYLIDEIGQYNESEKRDVLRKYIKGSAINNWVLDLSNHDWIIYADSQIDITKYPNIERHLKKYRDILAYREQVNNSDTAWFRIRGAKRKFFVNTGRHIVTPYRSKINKFAITDGSTYGAGDIYFLTNIDESLIYSVLAILNSPLIYFWFYNRGKRKGDMLEFYQTPLSKIPIAIPETAVNEKLSALVSSVIAVRTSNIHADTKSQESEINRIVYEIYGLTLEDVELIESSINEKY